VCQAQAVACACVADQVKSQLGKDVCSAPAAPPPPPPPPPPGTCDGASSSAQSSPRSGGATGAACTDSMSCQQIVCQCANGKFFYAAECINGQCNEAGACACVSQQVSALGQNVCS
jgi:hypothetical protein